jgi:site-specific DNA recombinase
LAFATSSVPASKVKDRMSELDTRKTELEKLLESAPEPPPVLVHPRMSDRYREEIGRLREALNDVSRREEAAEIVRGLFDSIVLQPSGSGRERTLTIDLTGHLAGILNLARETKKGAAGAPASDRQIKLVAGVGFEPTTFRL